VVLIILMMRMLGETATASPSTGSFADLARRALSGWAGFAVGWLYWYFRVIMVGFEAVSIARDHFSHLPSHPVLAVEEQP
jgi:GABA permease